MFDRSSIFPIKYQNHFTNNSMKELNINVDIGEGFNIEAEIMPLIQSCNIACGGHAGNNKEMSKLISLARQNNVKIGVAVHVKHAKLLLNLMLNSLFIAKANANLTSLFFKIILNTWR